SAPRVSRAIVRALAKVPADRFDSIQQFLNALIAPEGATTQATLIAETQRPSSSRTRGWLIPALAAVVLVAAVWWFVAGRESPRTPAGSRAVSAVAVLPFQDLADSSDVSDLGHGVTDGLIADLAEVGSLKVIAGASGSAAQGTARSLADLARELGVDGVVKGTIQRTGDDVLVNV